MLRRIALGLSILFSAAGLGACSSSSAPISIGPNFVPLSVYVTNSTQNAISIFGPNPTSASVPINQIGGSNTGLNGPQYLAFDATKHLYVTNFNPGTTFGQITEYAPQATGNVLPFAAIGGSGSSVGDPRGVALNSTGNIYVTNVGAPPVQASSILVFPAGSSGAVPPINVIAGAVTGLNFPTGIDLDSTGIIYVANTGNATLETFSATATGNAAPATAIGGPLTTLVSPAGLEVDGTGRILVADTAASAVDIFASGASGNVAPVARIAGAATTLSGPSDVAVDSAGNIYVTNTGTGKILVFAPGANGNVAPTQSITAPGTLVGIALSP